MVRLFPYVSLLRLSGTTGVFPPSVPRLVSAKKETARALEAVALREREKEAPGLGGLVVGGLGRFFSPMCPLFSRGWIGIILTGHENRILAS